MQGKNSSGMTSPTEAPALPEIEVAEDIETQLDPPSRVLLHNDDYTPYVFVVSVLCLVFEFSLPRAVEITNAAEARGVALVGVYPLEEAKYRVGQVHGLARAEGYPLTMTIEPEDA